MIAPSAGAQETLKYMDEYEEEVHHPRWFEWVEKNALPKRSVWPRPKRELTPWQKRGPMSRRDWVRFYHWCAKNATARPVYVPKPPPPETEDPTAKKKKKKKKVTLQQVYAHVDKLATPRNPRDKYEIPEEEDWPYSPKIDFKLPAKKDKGRPIEPPEVPKRFHHIYNELDFWYEVRFPVIRAAMRYKPSKNILRLAKPKITPPKRMHCLVPEKPVEQIPKRRRMSYRQWREHLRRLDYLAKPVVRPYYDYYNDDVYCH